MNRPTVTNRRRSYRAAAWTYRFAAGCFAGAAALAVLLFHGDRWFGVPMWALAAVGLVQVARWVGRRVAHLPTWAQRRIHRLEAELADLTDRVAAAEHDRADKTRWAQATEDRCQDLARQLRIANATLHDWRRWRDPDATVVFPPVRGFDPDATVTIPAAHLGDPSVVYPPAYPAVKR